MGIKMGIRIIIFHLQPGKRIGNLAGIGYPVPYSCLLVPMVRECRIKRGSRIESLLDIIQITVLLQGTEDTQVYLQPIIESTLGDIQFNGKVLEIVCPHHAIPVHNTEGSTIVGRFRASSQSYMMILHNPGPGYFIREIRIITQIQYVDITFGSHRPEIISRQHLHILIDSFHPETAIVTDTESTAFPFLRRHLDHPRSTTRTVLCRLGSIFQDSETLDIRRINGTKRIQVGRNAIDNNQRVVPSGQRSRSPHPDSTQCSRPVCSGRDTDPRRLSAQSVQRTGDKSLVHTFFRNFINRTGHGPLIPRCISNGYLIIQPYGIRHNRPECIRR